MKKEENLNLEEHRNLGRSKEEKENYVTSKIKFHLKDIRGHTGQELQENAKPLHRSSLKDPPLPCTVGEGEVNEFRPQGGREEIKVRSCREEEGREGGGAGEN